MGIHEGHRQRFKDRFLTSGLEGFSEHEMLELLLFYAIPYQDTNGIAHALTERFGGLAGVFEAPIDELEKVEGIGRHTSTLIKLVPQLCRSYLVSRAKENSYLLTPSDAGAYCAPLFVGERDELVYMICLDRKCMVLDCSVISRGGLDYAQIDIRKVAEHALKCGAVSVILTHNHRGGVAVPSEDDEMTTKRIAESLEAVGVPLSDHIIVAAESYFSMAQGGLID